MAANNRLPQSIATALADASRCRQAGNLSQAEQILLQILEANPEQAAALHALGGIAYQQGHYEQALTWLLRAVALDQANPLLQTNLGAVYRGLNRLTEAEQCYRHALRLKPDLAEAYNNLGNVLQAQGHSDEALARYRQAVLARPDYAEGHYNFGLALMEAARWPEAVEHLRRAQNLRPPTEEGKDSPLVLALLRAEAETRRQSEVGGAYPPPLNATTETSPRPEQILSAITQSLPEEATRCEEQVRTDPDCFEAYYRLGTIRARQGMLEEAVTAFAHATRVRPDHAESYWKLGAALREQGQAFHAAGYLQYALRLRPDLVEAHHRLGQSLVDLGRLEEAAEAFRAALRLEPAFLPALSHLGNLLEELGPAEEGQRLLDRALELGAEDAQTQTHYGSWLVDRGRLGEAKDHFLKALALQPDFAPAYFFLARDSHYPLSPADVQHLHELLQRDRLPRRHRIFAHFALSRVFDRDQAFAQAFYHCDQGNAHKRQLLALQGNAFRSDVHGQLVDRLLAWFTPAYFRRVQGLGSDSELPIFILGMPRSGTSLVEQILASHPAVHGAGEIRDLRLLVDRLPATLGSPAEYPECLAALTAPQARSLAEGYLHGLRRRGAEALRVTDKVPMHFHHLGLIAALWPRARIIHCRRDARDVCWSCYFQNFRELHFACDLKMLGIYYRHYERLMAHWHEVLPMPVFEVRYEELVADLETISRKMLAFCGLPWNEACLAFYRTARPVLTASNLQVRQPVYTKSISYWKHYEAYLGPLLEVLAEGSPGGANPGAAKE